MGRTKTMRPPQKSFVHSNDCKRLRVDPGLRSHGTRSEPDIGKHGASVASTDGEHLAPAVFVANDPYDPATARHLGQCEFVGETHSWQGTRRGPRIDLRAPMPNKRRRIPTNCSGRRKA